MEQTVRHKIQLAAVSAVASLSSLSIMAVPAAEADRPTAREVGDVAVTGTVLDASGTAPVTDAMVTAWWLPQGSAEPGHSLRKVELGRSTTDKTGSYTISSEPTPAMQRAAEANGGWLNFYVSGYSPSTGMATTMMLSREVQSGEFVVPDEVSQKESVESPVLVQRRAPKTRRAAILTARRSGTADEMGTVPASTAPEANLVLSKDVMEAPSPAYARAFARKSVPCTFTYGADTQSRQSVVEFHNAPNSTAGWSYGQSADSDIDGGIKYAGGGWGINGSSHIGNSTATSVGIDYATKQNRYGRTDFLVRNITITALGSAADGTLCLDYPSDLRVGTKLLTPYKWVGGATGNADLPGAEFIGCSSAPQSTHRTKYVKGANFSRTSGNAAKIGAAGDLGPIWVGAKSGFSTQMSIHYHVDTAPGIWLCGTNYFPTSAGVVHAENV